MKTNLFILSLVALTALTHTNYQIAAAAPDPRNPIQSRILGSHTRIVCSVAFSPDGSKLVTGSNDRTARIWYDTRVENHDAMRRTALALAYALHPRLGESSPAQLLDGFVLRDIMELARPESFGPIE